MKIRKLSKELINGLKQIVQIVSYKARRKDVSIINISRNFPLYVPNSAGSYEDRSMLTAQTINNVFPFLSSLSKSVNNKQLKITLMKDFPQSPEDIQAANDLKVLLDKNGSDKASPHDYHNLYGPILKNRDKIAAVFEVGLGTNNIDVVSTMGKEGKPGASLRAFRDFLPNAKIFGADVDKRILFTEDRIETFYVDQTDPGSFTPLQNSLPDAFDLIIDDGLHSPDANAQTLNFALTKIKVGGWVIVEDITANKISFWEVVTALLPDQYESFMFKAAEGELIFAVKRLN